MSPSNTLKGDDDTIPRATEMEADEIELARMGYKQELKYVLRCRSRRKLTSSTAAVNELIAGMYQSSERMYPNVTPSSAHPTSGGPYFWAAMLSKPEQAAFASWVTGWFNLLGQVAVTTGISFACATFISTASELKTSFQPNEKTTIGIYAAVLITQAILAKAPSHQSAEFVFRTIVDGTGADGVGWGERASKAYLVVIGILMAQYTLTGFDASAHASLLVRYTPSSPHIFYDIIDDRRNSERRDVGVYRHRNGNWSVRFARVVPPSGSSILYTGSRRNTQLSNRPAGSPNFLGYSGENGAIVLMVSSVKLFYHDNLISTIIARSSLSVLCFSVGMSRPFLRATPVILTVGSVKDLLNHIKLTDDVRICS
ncbi:APC amino acid permease [Salix suchowensis]|nr:APC amino acid permease [Salix suchowensis]